MRIKNKEAVIKRIKTAVKEYNWELYLEFKSESNLEDYTITLITPDNLNDICEHFLQSVIKGKPALFLTSQSFTDITMHDFIQDILLNINLDSVN